jgi:hypothetical protein
MGCLSRIGCLAVIAVVAVGGFLLRGLWLPKLRGTPKVEAASAGGWQDLTVAGGQRAQRIIAQLSQQGGPPSVTVTPSELMAYVVQSLGGALPESADSIQGSASGDRLCVRAVVRMADVADKKTLGPLSMLIGEREPVQMCGVIRIHSPGKGELQVKEFRIRELGIPGPAIPRIIKQMAPNDREGLADDGLPLQTPPYIGHVAVVNGQVIISKSPPSP